MANDLVIYTVMFGNYDSVNDPIIVYKNCDYKYITNNYKLKSKKWEIIYIKSEYNDIYQNRFYKILPHKIWPEYKYSIYIDSNIKIIESTYELIMKYLENTKCAIPRHPYRNCAYDEANYCILNKISCPLLLTEQMRQYELDGFPRNYGLTENSILIRKHNDISLIYLMEYWWEQYKKYQTRDQISLQYALWKTKQEIDKIDFNMRSRNKYFIRVSHKNEKIVNKLKNKIKMVIYILIILLKRIKSICI